MEILIVGVVVVALMVYVSTKIKKSVAAAFERETIDNKEFKLTKPEGFISPINENSKYAFEADSKDFGKNDAGDFRQARASLHVVSEADFETEVKTAENNAVEILSKKVVEDALSNQKNCLIESRIISGNVGIILFDKIVESTENRKIYHLQISILDAYQLDYADRTNEMLESFVVK